VVRLGFVVHGLDPAPVETAARGEEGCHILSDVFVYGTLLTGEANHRVAVGASLDAARPATLAGGSLRDLGRYPALVLADGGEVQGELLSFRDIAVALLELDRLEHARAGCEPGGLYRRTVLDVTVGDGRTRRAWAYVMEEAGAGSAPVIARGSWRGRSVVRG
jgi:gamma-glutamylcyclotransferase (GGCT)/AIG2-like uncharacterized protein YtfP